MKKSIQLTVAAMAGGMIALLGHSLLTQNLYLETVSSSNKPEVSLMPAHFTQAAKFNFNENSFVEASEKTLHSVVHVKNMTVAPEVTSIFDLIYGRGRNDGKEYLLGTGSGVIISPDGYIVTNNHVIEKASSVQVTLNNNKTYKAEIIGADPSTDIALLKIKADEKFPYLTFADSDKTQIGEWVLAVGNPFNLTSTVTAGIISAKARNLGVNSERIDSFIQTDAAVNSGNSGGALVNLRGELIGINTAIASSQTGTFVGYSFAVPSNIAKKVVEDLVEYGSVQKAILGINGVGLNSEVAKKLEITQTEGFFIEGVETESGAEKAGIKRADIIIDIDGIKIRTFADLKGHINTKRPGETISVTVLRDKITRNFKVLLQKNTQYRINNLGIVVKDISEKDKKIFKVKHGVKIVQESEFYKQQGIGMVGKVLLAINTEEIKSINDLENILSKLNPNQRNALLLINERGEKERYFF